MKQLSSTGTKLIELDKVFRKWKWVILFASVIILAGTLAFVLVKNKKNISMGVMMPIQVSFTFNEEGKTYLSTRSLNKYDYEKLSIFLLNRDLFKQYLEETHQGEFKKSYNLQKVVSSKYALDFSSAAVRNETLQYLLIKINPDAGLSVDMVGSFILNVFKNYNLLNVFQDYYNHLQKLSLRSLDSQRLILDRIGNISVKIARLREQGEKYRGVFTGRGDFMLQVNHENERYLDLRQQLAANDILLSDKRIDLELNRREIARMQFMIQLLNELRQKYLKNLFRDPNLAKIRLQKIQAGLGDQDLSQETLKLAAMFDVIDDNFKIYRADPKMFGDRYLIIKALALCFFAFGLLLLTILALEYWRINRT